MRIRQKSIDRIEDADLVLYVVDSSVPLSEEDMDIMNLVKNRKCIVLLNKNDLEQIVSENVIREMFSSIDANAFEKIVSYTTRQPRDNEENGKDYWFVDNNTFREIMSRDLFAEHDEYSQNRLIAAVKAEVCHE